MAAGVGEAAAVLTLLTTVIQAAQGAYREYNDIRYAPTYADDYHTDLTQLERDLNEWARIWGYTHTTPDEEKAVWYWGEEIWGDIRKVLTVIRNYYKDVHGHVKDIHDRLTPDPTAKRRVKDLVPFTKPAHPGQTPKLTLLAKVIVALKDNQHIRTFLQLLQASVAKLKRISFEGYIAEHPDAELNDHSIAAAWRVQKAWQCLTKTHQKLHKQGSIWSVLLSTFWEQGIDFQTSNELELGLVYSSHFRDEQKGHLVEAKYINSRHGVSDRTNKFYKEILGEVSGQNLAVVFGDPFKNKFHAWLDKSLDEQVSTRARSRESRANMALHLAAWVVILWKSDWVKGLCTCGIGYVNYDERESGSLAEEEFVPIICSSHSYRNVTCSNAFAHAQSRPHLLLGTVLAELAIARPVSISSLSGETSGVVRFRIDPVLQEVHAASLVDHIWHATRSRAYLNAVTYCFNRDKIAEKRNSFEAEDVDRYHQQVVKPLKEYCRLIAPEDHKYSDIPTVFRFVDASTDLDTHSS